MKTDVQEEHRFNLLPKIIDGAIAGIVGITCVFPLDLVKTRLQKQQVGPGGQKMYRNMLDAFIKTYKAEGLLGMYSGAAVNLILVTPEKAVTFAANDLFRFYLTTKDGELPLVRQMVAGAMAGFWPFIFTNPMELLKIQLQDAGRVAAKARAAGQKVETVTTLGLVGNIIKEKGILGLYKGTSATLMRDMYFSMLFFPSFAAINKLGPRRQIGSGEAVFWWSLLSGLLAGSFAAYTATPFDVVKTRLQTLRPAVGERTYTGLSDAFWSIRRNEGRAALYTGGRVRIMVIAPLFGIAQAVYFLGLGEKVVDFAKYS